MNNLETLLEHHNWHDIEIYAYLALQEEKELKKRRKEKK